MLKGRLASCSLSTEVLYPPYSVPERGCISRSLRLPSYPVATPIAFNSPRQFLLFERARIRVALPTPDFYTIIRKRP